MNPSRISTSVLILSAALVAAGCASAPPEQLAARDCKVAVADFPGKPAKNVTRAEQAEAQLRISRLSYERGGYGSGTNVVAEIARDCY